MRGNIFNASVGFQKQVCFFFPFSPSQWTAFFIGGTLAESGLESITPAFSFYVWTFLKFWPKMKGEIYRGRFILFTYVDLVFNDSSKNGSYIDIILNKQIKI